MEALATLWWIPPKTGRMLELTVLGSAPVETLSLSLIGQLSKALYICSCKLHQFLFNEETKMPHISVLIRQIKVKMCRTFGACIRHSFTCFTECAFYCSGLPHHSVGWRSVIRLTWSDGLKSSSSMKKIRIFILISRKWSNWWIFA